MQGFGIKTTRSSVNEADSRKSNRVDAPEPAAEVRKPGDEPPTHAKQRYRSSSIRFEMDGKQFEIYDISATGICLRDPPGWIEEGQALSFALLLVGEDGLRRISLSGVVYSREADEIVVTYPLPFENWDKFLRDFTSQNI